MDSTAFQKFQTAFHTSGQPTPLIVYDIDDVLWGLMPRIAARGGLDPATCYAIFNLADNPELSASDRDYIIKSFSNADIFREINFYPGVSDILLPETLGAQVKINSNCYSSAIAELKISQLLQTIPDLSADHIQVNLIDYDSTHRKSLDPHTTILIDDSPYNIAKSPALLNVMPANVAWSVHPSAKAQVKHQSVVWQPDLNAINHFVYQTVQSLLQPV